MVETVDYHGWKNTYRLSNGLVQLYAVADIGPRIADFRTSEGDNAFYLRPNELGRAGEKDWVFRGGWRLWVSPEVRDITYVPDNQPCTAEVDGDTLRLTGVPEKASGVRKSVEIRLVPGEPRARIVSRLRNVGSKPVRYAAWSLSVMQPGGRALLPIDPGDRSAFADIRTLVLWSYARWSDPRYAFGDRLLQVDQSRVPPTAQSPAAGRRPDESKIGSDSSLGWSAYLNGGTLYVKRFPIRKGADYPDGGSTVEVYSSGEFLELENLSPLITLQPGEELVYPEEWALFSDVSIPTDPEKARAALAPYVGGAPLSVSTPGRSP